MIKKIIILYFAFISTTLFSQAQPMAFEDWKTTTGTQNFFYKNITKTDGLGNVYVAGATVNGSGNTDILLAKYDKSGIQLWIQQYAGSANGIDFASDLVVTNTYAYLTGAVTTNTATMIPDVITMMYRNNGTLQWASTYNGTANSYDIGKSIIIDASGNSYITGTSYNSSPNADIVIIKYNGSGAQQWVQTYNHSSNLDDAGFKIAIKGTSEITVSGALTVGTNQYKYGTFICSQSNGSITATNIGTVVTTSSITVVTDFATDATGNSIIVGSMYVAGQGDNMYVQKLSTTLVPAWTYTYNNANNLDDVAKAVQIDASGNVYITGYNTHPTQGKNITTIKLNSSGSQQWIQTINSTNSGNDEAADMAIDANSNIYVTGTINSDINQADYYTVKYNTIGTKLWEVQTDGNHLNDRATNIALDSLNNVIVVGQSEISAGSFQFLTTKYVQQDVITPTDFNGEFPVSNFRYYENKGQLISTTLTAVPDVKYYTNNTYPSHYIMNNSSSFVFARLDSIKTTNDTLQRIDVTYDNALSTKTYPLEQQKDGYLNYFLPQTGSSGATVIFGNQRLISPNIYPNIDLMYSSNQNGIKYYYIVKPGGDPRNIAMTFTGATSYSLNTSTSELTINTLVGGMKFDRPTVYQLSATNSTIAVTTWTPSWVVNTASNKYKFNSGSYTTSLTLVIEVDQGNSVSTAPSSIQNLKWCTYYGGGSDDVFLDVCTNNTNNVWVTGYTQSVNFPVTNFYQGTNAGNTDAIFVKFNNLGIRQWATYFGGSNTETDYHIHGIEVDASGNSYSAFNTLSTDMPLNNSGISGAYFDSSNTTTFGCSPGDIAIVSFNNNGILIWSTYFGGNGCTAKTYDIGLDGNNNLIVTGIDNGFPLVNPPLSYSNSFPISSAGAYFIAKFNPSHSLVWSTFFGENGPMIEKIAFTSNNDIVIIGNVNNQTGANFETKNFGGGAYFDNTFNGGAYDGFIAKFDGVTNALLWSTFYGGNNDDRLHGLAIDNSNNIYISGESMSNTGLITGNSFGLNNTNYAGMGSYFNLPLGDGILAKFNSSNQFVSSTYFGGAANDGSFGLTCKNNVLYAPFVTAGTDLPFYSNNPSNTFVQTNNLDGQDVAQDSYFTAMDNNFNFKWSTYFGGTNTIANPALKNDIIYSNIVTNDNKYYIVGTTTSNLNFPLVNPLGGAYYNGTKSSTVDAFIAQFDISTLFLPVSIKESIKENEKLLIYPNPANNFLYIKYNTTSKYSIEIIDIIGRMVYFSENHNNTIEKVNTEYLTKGSYVVKITDKDSITVKKLIIE